MKFNIEIDNKFLEGLSEEDIKEGLIKEIIREIDTTKLKEKTIKALDDKASEIVIEKVGEIFNPDIKIPQYNNWGKLEKEITVEEFIKGRIETALNQKVDDYGRRNSYGKYTLIEFLLERQVKNQIEVKTKEYIAEIDKKIKEYFTEEFKNQIVSKLVENINLFKK